MEFYGQRRGGNLHMLDMLLTLAMMTPEVAKRTHDRIEKEVAKRNEKQKRRNENERNRKKNRNAKKRRK